MFTVAYLANEFPAAVEPYVVQEIREFQRRGIRIIPGTVRSPHNCQSPLGEHETYEKIVCLEKAGIIVFVRALVLCARRWKQIAALTWELLFENKELPIRRLKTLLHTFLGACYAVSLQDQDVSHIHVHHGYFGSWVAMVAARLLGVSFSMTLHGSDLLLRSAYLGAKLEHCLFCVTISDFNRHYILDHFPAIPPEKILVSRLGVDASQDGVRAHKYFTNSISIFSFATVGRLHKVKDHEFLIRACIRLRDRGLVFRCLVGGEGPERSHLESLIRKNRLEKWVMLLGHVPREEISSFYRTVDVVVLTSRSEGIPLVLMEAMAQGTTVLAPAITGIPELVIPGKTGFLYSPGSLDDFTKKISFLHKLISTEGKSGVSRLDWVRHAALTQVAHNFNRSKNLTHFADQFLKRLATNISCHNRSSPNADPILQQI